MHERGLYKGTTGVIETSSHYTLEKSLDTCVIKLLKVIDKLEKKHGIDLIVIESTPFSTNYRTTFLMSAFEGVVRYTLYKKYGRSYHSKVITVPVRTVRQACGYTTKKDVYNKVNTKYELGFRKFESSTWENDVTDAVALAQYGISYLKSSRRKKK